jgi:hypothetical protein
MTKGCDAPIPIPVPFPHTWMLTLGLTNEIVAIETVAFISNDPVRSLSRSGAAISAGKLQGSAIVNISHISLLEIQRGIFYSADSPAFDSPNVIIDQISLEDVALLVHGSIGFDARNDGDDSSLIFTGPVHILWDSASPSDPCVTFGDLQFRDGPIELIVNTRSFCGHDRGIDWNSTDSDNLTILDDFPSYDEELGNRSSLHFGRIVPSATSNFRFSIGPVDSPNVSVVSLHTA